MQCGLKTQPYVRAKPLALRIRLQENELVHSRKTAREDLPDGPSPDSDSEAQVPAKGRKIVHAKSRTLTQLQMLRLMAANLSGKSTKKTADTQD